MIFKKFWPSKRDLQRKTFQIYGLLSNKFNSDFSITTIKKNYTDKKDYFVSTRSLYQSSEKKYGKTYYPVGEWPKSKLHKSLIFKEYGDKNILSSFYYPMELIELDTEFLKALGPPLKIHKAIMLTSGRSLLLNPENTHPFILKIGTFRYSRPKIFRCVF